MLGSFASLAGALALMVASVNAQCGGTVSNINNTTRKFTVETYNADVTVLTISGLNNNPDKESYLLYCGATAPDSTVIQTMGLSPSVKQFKVPVTRVLSAGNFTSSYIELAGGQSNIAVLENPQNIVSPCLQYHYRSGLISPLDSANLTQYESLDVGFRQFKSGEPKDVWVPESEEVAPLQRVEYLMAVSLFFNNATAASIIYDKIIGTYNILKMDMERIPKENKMRIGWVKYDFGRRSWILCNTPFIRGIINDAGGIPFPLKGDGLPSYPDISPSDFKILMTNADVIIDQTDLTDGKGNETSVFSRWRALAGFTGMTTHVLDMKRVYSLDNTMNQARINDYQYRMPSRPDLLLRDVIAVQYPQYNPEHKFRFLNTKFYSGEGATNQLGPENCVSNPAVTTPFPYNSGDITAATFNPLFTGGPPPPPAVGGGIYGIGGDSQGGDTSNDGKNKTTSIIIAVVCVAAVLGAAFAFAFYKWSRRAKEDRFIELEEEMNNEIPLN
ncbi:hypothetical protein BG015_010279 [Linnemannia schmuckeri]|uniref:Uncharacterized protein n=1 Tax=Linnemannia schmuckeri TaxID=64567 RepID=A0A9P5RXS6_9FUNG|nr:hypothetical protein BG015_010279 [Linnemannia schmuckeri]